eukprot:7338294-Pyramimonas_sp.AAC.1
MKYLRGCSMPWAFADLKIVGNGWLTSHRILQPHGRLCCRFGCADQPDAVRHYLECPSFRRLVEQELGCSRPASALGRLGLLGSAVQLDRVVFDVVVMYYTYVAAAHGSNSHVWAPQVARSFVKAAVRTAKLGASSPARAPLVASAQGSPLQPSSSLATASSTSSSSSGSSSS